MISKALFFLLLSLAIPAYAATSIAEQEACFDKASARYSIDKKILKAIAKTESNFTEKIFSKPNSNMSVDIGMMQINSSWLPTLSKFGIGPNHLLDACTNIHVGAWILANNFATYGRTWKAIGAYNSVSPNYQVVYARKVYANYASLENTKGF
jgi:soluble lytic murein transglycosylase-like protein